MSCDEQAKAPTELLDKRFLDGFTDRWLAVLNAHDPRQVAALCTDDVEWQQPSFQASGS